MGFQHNNHLWPYQSYLINYDESNNNFYSLALYNNGVSQKYTSDTKGYNNKYNLNVAIQLKEDFYFGLNINTHEIFLENFLSHYESNFDENSAIKSILFENRLTTYGEGFFISIRSNKKV
jgi:hypothetical protein